MKKIRIAFRLVATLFIFFAASCNNGTTTEKFQYKNNPSENPLVLRDAIEDPTAVYGYSPNPADTSKLKEFANKAEYDWTNPDEVNGYRQRRIEYHQANDTINILIQELEKEGKTAEEIANFAVVLRNINRLNDYINNRDYEGLTTLLERNKSTYGNEFGPTPAAQYEKYGSWETVVEKSKSINAGMDACCGLYDDYYHLYPVETKTE